MEDRVPTRLMDMFVAASLDTQVHSVKQVSWFDPATEVNCTGHASVVFLVSDFLSFLSDFFCRIDVDECSSNPCLNGGCCTDQVNGYACSCQPGYAGAQCQTSNISWFDSATEVNCTGHASVVFLVSDFLSFLSDFFCRIDVDECSSNPCLNGGCCTDQVNGYACSCQPGYAGAQCQTSKFV